MVNSATGFIGPETHLNDFELMVSNLQDNFMGKILGLPMGVSPSYTLHADTHMEGQQMATHLATAAGANFFMDIYLGTDRMLAHFVNSGHDDQTLREVHNRIPAPEFLEWAKKKASSNNLRMDMLCAALNGEIRDFSAHRRQRSSGFVNPCLRLPGLTMQARGL
jgi:ethanolamine ammonia-lyase large subunit